MLKYKNFYRRMEKCRGDSKRFSASPRLHGVLRRLKSRFTDNLVDGAPRRRLSFRLNSSNSQKRLGKVKRRQKKDLSF